MNRMRRRRSRMNRVRRRRLNRMRIRSIRRRRRRSRGRRGRMSRLNRMRRRSRLNRMRRISIRRRRYMEELTRRRSIRIREYMKEVEELTSDDLIRDILSRLPILSLLRSRCVCKFWRSSTNEHTFSILRLNKSLITNNKSIFTDAVILTPQSKQLYYIFFEEQEDNPIFKKIDLSFIPHTQPSRLSIVGVCHGIMCLVTYTQNFNDLKDRDDRFKSFYILNPITGQYQHLLPNFEIQGGDADPMFKMRLISGFGFDKTEQVFKMVLFVWYDNPSSNIPIRTIELQILTLGGLGNQADANNIWRRKVVSFPDTNYHSFRGYASDKLDVFLNGSFYWIAAADILDSDEIHDSAEIHDSPYWAIFIAKFNLGNEDVDVVFPPQRVDIEELDVMIYYTLGVLENCLCLVDSMDNELIDIWIRINDHGVGAWSKKFSIQTILIAPDFDSRLVIPIKDNGEHILLVHYGRVIVYNSASNTCRFFEIDEELERGYVFDAFPIVGSLIRV